MAASASESVHETARYVPGLTLGLLFLANVLNFADRAILGIVTDPIRIEFALSDTQISIVNGFAFVAFNLLAGIFIARWVDAGNRRIILAGGVSLWAIATMLTGWTSGFGTLAVTRIMAGVGEATIFPAAISMIADLYRSDRQPRAVAIFQSSQVVGIMVGSVAAGILAASFGWRGAFQTFGATGIVFVALFLLFTREPARTNPAPGQDGLPQQNMLQAIGAVLSSRGYLPLALGYSIAAMTTSVMPVWGPTLLLRSHGVALQDVGAVIAPGASFGGVTGALLGGYLATALMRRRGSASIGLLVPMISLPLAIPFDAVFILADNLTVSMIGMTIMNLLIAMHMGPVIALAARTVPSNLRALSSTLLLVGQGLLGAALAPFIVGVLSDHLAATAAGESLRYALTGTLVCPLIASFFIWIAYRKVRDTLDEPIDATQIAH